MQMVSQSESFEDTCQLICLFSLADKSLEGGVWERRPVALRGILIYSMSHIQHIPLASHSLAKVTPSETDWNTTEAIA